MSSVLGIQPLTDRERDIVRLLFEGYTNREMGEKLGVSWLTVRNHISRLLAKFEAKNRTDLLASWWTPALTASPPTSCL